MTYFNSLSMVTLQHLVDVAQTYGDIEPIINAGGFTQTVAISAANSVMNAICAVAFPHKWNEFNIPPIYTNSLQQDYAVVNPAGVSGNLVLTAVSLVSSANGTAVYAGSVTGGDFNGYAGVPFVITGFVNSGNNGTFMCASSTSTTLTLVNTGGVLETHAGNAISAAGPLLNMSWLERGVAFDINNSAVPKPYVRIECGRQLPQIQASYVGGRGLGDPGFFCNWFPNRTLYYGIWGAANVGNATVGNNPVANSVYTQPLGSNSQPLNPITQIIDANGNYLLLTGYGHEGSGAPLAARNATPGTTVSGVGATTTWTVLDPNGWGFRFTPVPSTTGTEWQFNLTAQMKPVRFTSLSQTLAPLPDEFEPHFRQGFIAELYGRSPEKAVFAKYQVAWQQWLRSLQELRIKEDRELEENKFIPARTVFGASRSRSNFQGGAWPFNYPRP
ncbi:Uncharacterised protein [uncultured archaeon]|nr:Uncharacterised protein [uncultured archaeon]